VGRARKSFRGTSWLDKIVHARWALGGPEWEGRVVILWKRETDSRRSSDADIRRRVWTKNSLRRFIVRGKHSWKDCLRFSEAGEEKRLRQEAKRGRAKKTTCWAYWRETPTCIGCFGGR